LQRYQGGLATIVSVAPHALMDAMNRRKATVIRKGAAGVIIDPVSV